MDSASALRAIAKGDRSAFAALYKSMQRPMLRYATGLLAGDREAAEDAVDEAFIDIWRKAQNWSATGSAEGWIRQIVRNKSIDWLRKQKGEVSASHEIDDALAQLSDVGPSQVEQLEHQSEAAGLRLALAKLSIEHREALWLCYFEEKPLSEIATICQCPENTVKTRLFHARKRLKAQIEQIA